MNKQEKTQFILDITDNLRDALLERVEKIPEQWDGIELRQLLVDVARSQFNCRQMSPARKRSYNNTVLVKNLD